MRFIQKITAMFGVVFIAVALLGFLTGGMSMDAHMSSAPRILGLFPVNVVRDLDTSPLAPLPSHLTRISTTS